MEGWTRADQLDMGKRGWEGEKATVERFRRLFLFLIPEEVEDGQDGSRAGGQGRGSESSQSSGGEEIAMQ